MATLISPGTPIGLFDSGLGGLTVLRELTRAFPRRDFVYLGDTARTPYGSKGAATIVRYARECARFLQTYEIGALVVACNTASSVALAGLQAEFPGLVIGTIEPAVEEALRTTRSGVIAVIGTEGTIASGEYERQIRLRAPEAEIISQSCPLFVPLVEHGHLAGEIVEKVVAHYLRPLDFSRIDTLILGCTHYPLLMEAIRAEVGPAVHLVDSARPIAASLRPALADGEAGPGGSRRFFVTDAVSRFNHLARLFLEGEAVTAVQVEDLGDQR